MGWQEILSSAPRADERNDVEYFEVESRRVLNPARLPWLPFDLTLNPYLQCELGCAYCYAREHADRRARGAGGPDRGAFDRRIYAKTGAPAVLRDELARLSRLGGLGGKEIALGTATDPYQPYERRARLTRALLEVFATVEDVRLSITTKSDLVLRDLDVLQAIGRKGHVQVNVTITTVDRDLARSLEPRAPTPARRLRAVEGLARAGVPVGVFCMPVLPELTEASRDLRAIVCAAREAGAAWFAANVLFLRGEAVRAAFFAWLEGAFPALVPRYRRLYQGPSAPEAITDRVTRVVEALRRQYGLPPHVPWPAPRAGPRQLSLFEAAPSVEPLAPAERRPGRALPVLSRDPRAASA